MSQPSKAKGPANPQEEDIPPPTGTIFILSAYILLLSAMWVGMLFHLITR